MIRNGVANKITMLFVKVPTSECFDNRYYLMTMKSCCYSAFIHRLSFLVSPTTYCLVLIIHILGKTTSCPSNTCGSSGSSKMIIGFYLARLPMKSFLTSNETVPTYLTITL